MKKQVFYIHGGESFLERAAFLERLRTKGIWDLPDQHKVVKWTDRLRADLGDSYEVFMPQMPNKQNARFDEWSLWFERHFPYLREGVILVGCSLGAAFLIRYLSERALPVHIKEIILMASPLASPGFATDDWADFVSPLEAIPQLSTRASHVTLMYSEDDFLIPREHAAQLHTLLPGSALTMFTDKNHFLVPELPELVAHIKGLE